MGNITVTAAQAAEKWARNLGNSTEDIKRGINAVEVSPTELAAQAKDKWVAGVQRAAQEGKFEAGLRRVNLADWRKAAIEKGLPRISSGAQAAVPKMTAFMTDLLPHEARLMEEIDVMPDTTIEDSIARMGACARGMASFRRS